MEKLSKKTISAMMCPVPETGTTDMLARSKCAWCVHV